MIRTRSSLTVVLSAVNAALYAGLGALWIAFPIVVFGIRFWPQVFVPAAFAVLFGPWVGGVGAAIGIFLADVIYGHHDALLSVLVGVPANFLGFFVLGRLTHNVPTGLTRRFLFALSLLIPILIAGYAIYWVYLISGSSSLGGFQYLVVGVGLLAVLAITGLTVARNRWADFEVAASIGLGLGSLLIGVTIVAYASIFGLPTALGTLPSDPVYAVTSFTYLSEIPFLILLTPPVVKAVRAALPSLAALQRDPAIRSVSDSK